MEEGLTRLLELSEEFQDRIQLMARTVVLAMLEGTASEDEMKLYAKFQAMHPTDDLAPYTALGWLLVPHRLLDMQPPVLMLVEGDSQRVFAAFNATFLIPQEELRPMAEVMWQEMKAAPVATTLYGWIWLRLLQRFDHDEQAAQDWLITPLQDGRIPLYELQAERWTQDEAEFVLRD